VFGRLDAEARLFGGVRFWALAVGFLGASSSPRLDAAGGAGVLGPRGCFLAWWSFPPCFFVGAPGSLLEAFSSPQPGAAGEACAFWASGRVGPGVLFGRPAGVFSALPCLWGSARTLGIGDASLSLLERVRSDLLRYLAPRASYHLPEPLFERTRLLPHRADCAAASSTPVLDRSYHLPNLCSPPLPVSWWALARHSHGVFSRYAFWGIALTSTVAFAVQGCAPPRVFRGLSCLSR